MNQVVVHVDGSPRTVARGTPVGELLESLGVDGDELVAALFNRRVVSLAKRLYAEGDLEPVLATEPAGELVVRRTASLLMNAAAVEHFPDLQLVVGQTLLGGYFYEALALPDGVDLDLLAERINEQMQTFCERDTPIHRMLLPVELAPGMLSDASGSKARLLRTWSRSKVPLLRLGSFVDLQYGPVAPSLRHVRGARVRAATPGIVLYPTERMLSRASNSGVALFETFRETRAWNRRVGVHTVGDLNQVVLSDLSDEVVRVSEGLHEKKIAHIADTITEQTNRVRFACVAGPSSSGKTTFVRRLSVQLRVNGVRPQVLSLDDYYRGRDRCPRDENGELDFEALEALDVTLLNDQLARLAAGETVETPRYNFAEGVRSATTVPMTVLPGQVVLLEGIHCLNPRLLDAVPEDSVFRIYINALSQLVLDDHNRIFTSDGRLLRRIVRDRRYRGTSAAETIARWPSVRRGEARHIFPFDEEADVTFNSALVYETAVLKTFAWRYLLEVPRDHPSRTQAARLLDFLELFVPVFPDAIPPTSVLREFIGGSGFTY